MKYPTVFDLIASEFKRAGILHVLVGGFAVNHYGVTRQTLDVDFMIVTEDYLKALEILKPHGYEEILKHDIFTRLKSPKKEWMDVDFLFVDSKTIRGILKTGGKTCISGHAFMVPSLEHLIAMKLHSLKHNIKMREYKDLMDILGLIQGNKVDVRTEKFRKLCTDFGTQEVYQKIVKFSG